MDNLVLRTEATPAAVRVYVDESKARCNAAGQQWLYIGVLAIPEALHLGAIRSLLADRAACRCDSELHFAKISAHGGKPDLAQRWLKRFLFDDRRTFHFHVLGINIDNLQEGRFGDRKAERRQAIYTRFVRTAVTYLIKRCFGTPTRITRWFHDSSVTELELHPYFGRYAPSKLRSDHPGITFGSSEVLFVNSNHHKELRFPQESHLIQLTDLILGSARQALDATSGSTLKQGLGELMHPMISRVTDPKRWNNPNSEYHHFKRCSVSFFPSKALTLDEVDDAWERAQSSFYRQRPLLYVPRGMQQASLF